MFTSVKLAALAALLFLAPEDVLAGRTYHRRGPRFQKVSPMRRQQDPQVSTTLDPKVIQRTGTLTGQEGGGDPGQSPSLTSSNNFINFCLTQPVPLTEGKQIEGGSCNPTPIGRIAAKNKQPSAKFQFPANLDASLQANVAFTVVLQVKQIQLGTFVNPNVKYFAAPQTVNDQGFIIGHSHIVIEAIPSLTSTQVTDPTKFAFFKGINQGQDGNGNVSVAVDKGLPAGSYRMCTINSSANHQPAIVAVAQHGSLDDCVYFTVGGGNGQNNNGQNNNQGGNNGQNNNGQNNNGQNNNQGGNNGQNNNQGGNNGQNNNQGGNNGQNNGQGQGNNNNGQGNNGAQNNGGNGGSRLNFQETLGGAPPPAVTQNQNGTFSVNGNIFQSFNDARQRACDIQRNTCGDAANRSGNKAPLNQPNCEAQAGRCRSAPQA